MSDPEWWEDNIDYERVTRETRKWELGHDRLEDIVGDALAEKIKCDASDLSFEWSKHGVMITLYSETREE